ncbi:MMPL family protein [Phycisphaerae bacterium RAS2]|nr:MMPL family protein [Phycisphaerae bacterium RAS2]
MTDPLPFAVRRPRLTLGLALLAALVAAPGLTKLHLRTDGHALVPHNAPQVQTDRAIRADFGLTDPIVVVLRSDTPDGIYNAATIARLANLSRAIQQLDGIDPDDVASLATEKSHRVRTGTLDFLDMLDPLPQAPAELATLRDDVRRIELYRGTLVSRDERAAAIYVGVHEGADRLPLFHRIREVVRDCGVDPQIVHITGSPVAESLLGTHILEDLGVPIALIDPRYASHSEPAADSPRDLESLRLWIAHHVGLLPIAIAVMTLIFLIAFRSLAAVALTWLKTVACLIITFGVMGWVDSPIYLTTAVIPVILIAIGVSDEVHLFNRYARKLAEASFRDETPPVRSPRERAQSAMTAAMSEVRRPIVLTSVTTAIAFLSFVLSPLEPVRAFGLFTALGAIVCLAWALTGTPAAVVLLHPRWFQKASPADDAVSSSPSRIEQMGLAIAGRPRGVVMALVLVLALAALGIGRIEIQDSWIDGFSPASQFHRDTQYFNQSFLGMHVLYVCVDTGTEVLKGTLDEARIDHFALGLPGDLTNDLASLIGRRIELSRDGPPPENVTIMTPTHGTRIKTAARQGDRIAVGIERLDGSPRFTMSIQKGEAIRFEIRQRRLADPKTLTAIRDLERFLAARTDDRVGGALGPAAYVETTSYLARGRQDQARVIPKEASQLDYVWKWFANIRGPKRTRATVDADFARGIISVYMNHANFRDTARLIDAVRHYEREHLTPIGLSLSLAGDVAVSQALIDAIVSTEVRSVSLSLLGVLVVCVVITRSLKWGLLSILPCVVAVPVNFALMGWCGIPLGVATSMFTAMTIGIGVDYAIHFIERYRREIAAGRDAPTAVGRSLHVAGRGILIDALSVGLGFSVLILSQVPANARLAVMVVASIATCLLTTLCVLPAALLSRRIATD